MKWKWILDFVISGNRLMLACYEGCCQYLLTWNSFYKYRYHEKMVSLSKYITSFRPADVTFWSLGCCHIA